MRTIFYDYQSGGPHGAIIDEKYPGVGAVSSIDPVLPSGHGTVDSFTETRGDGPSRIITYTHLVPALAMTATAPALSTGESEPHNQMLDHYTDFPGNNTTWLYYDPDTWYLTSVQDANGNTTAYARASPPPTGIGQITKITPPDLRTSITVIRAKAPTLADIT